MDNRTAPIVSHVSLLRGIGKRTPNLAGAIVATLLLLLQSGRVDADMVGEARIIDGDTVEIGGERIRLHGIDAPESRQTCTVVGQEWRCGESATLALVDETNGQPLTCKGNKRDRYGRLIAVCYAGSDDLNAWMVREGWAVAYRRYSKDYVDEEAEARAAGNGVWRGEFMLPWKWRQTARQAAQR
jgi:endonuclease YncB( thermonuclease family)